MLEFQACVQVNHILEILDSFYIFTDLLFQYSCAISSKTGAILGSDSELQTHECMSSKESQYFLSVVIYSQHLSVFSEYRLKGNLQALSEIYVAFLFYRSEDFFPSRSHSGKQIWPHEGKRIVCKCFQVPREGRRSQYRSSSIWDTSQPPQTSQTFWAKCSSSQSFSPDGLWSQQTEYVAGAFKDTFSSLCSILLLCIQQNCWNAQV